jgi:hypothetical protein
MRHLCILVHNVNIEGRSRFQIGRCESVVFSVPLKDYKNDDLPLTARDANAAVLHRLHQS